jgi:glycosyltransferase involved in cell wall biosynthesis
MIFTGDPSDAGAISGMPFAAARALERLGIEIVPLRAAPPVKPPSPGVGVRSRLRDALKRRAPERLREWASNRALARGPSILDTAHAAAARIGEQITAAQRDGEIDAIVGMCVSVPLAFLRTDLPIVYASDATARIVLTSYPRYARRPASYRADCEECELRALRMATRIGLASEVAVRSAIQDYRIAPERVRLLPLGCHVVPDENAPVSVEPPSRESIRLLIVASDPERKRIGLAIETVEILRRRGFGAELVHIGAPHRMLRRSCVRSLGALRLADPADRARHHEAIRSTHLSILPSCGEAFGIAPAESALAGRPAIVSDAGGLPTVVRDGATGIVMPTAASPEAWADAIAALVEDPERYRRLASAARERAWREFTWDAWARHVSELVEESIFERSSGHFGLNRTPMSSPERAPSSASLGLSPPASSRS